VQRLVRRDKCEPVVVGDIIQPQLSGRGGPTYPRVSTTQAEDRGINPDGADKIAAPAFVDIPVNPPIARIFILHVRVLSVYRAPENFRLY
jgi:hypothetical protein